MLSRFSFNYLQIFYRTGILLYKGFQDQFCLPNGLQCAKMVDGTRAWLRKKTNNKHYEHIYSWTNSLIGVYHSYHTIYKYINIHRDSEAQLGLLLEGGNILFCNGLGWGLRGGFPPFSKIFRKHKCFFKGLKSKKRKF